MLITALFKYTVADARAGWGTHPWPALCVFMEKLAKIVFFNKNSVLICKTGTIFL